MIAPLKRPLEAAGRLPGYGGLPAWLARQGGLRARVVPGRVRPIGFPARSPRL